MAQQLGTGKSKVRMKLNYSRWRSQKLNPRIATNMGRAMDHLRDRIKQMVGKAGHGKPSPAGKPPHLQSGDYQKSIKATVHRTPKKNVVGRVGTDSPYGRRLEFGFVGRDKLGRNYNQAPRPHFRPAVKRHGKKVGQLVATGR